MFNKSGDRDFPGGPVGNTPCSQCRGLGLIPDWGTRSRVHATTKSLHATTKILRAATKTQRSQNK